MSIGSNIKKWRELRNLKQAELAELVGVSDKTVSSWEINRTEPKMGMVEKICSALQCKKTDIIGDNDVILNSRDNRDIKKDLDAIMERLTTKEAGPAAYDGEELSPEAAELFRDELELALKILKYINKDKYNPNKNK